MLEVDKLLEDKELIELVQKALKKRRPRSSTFGRIGTPAEVVLRMLILKHQRDWSFVDLVREVRANVVYRDFTRIGGQKVPEPSTLIKIANHLGPEAIRAKELATDNTDDTDFLDFPLCIRDIRVIG